MTTPFLFLTAAGIASVGSWRKSGKMPDSFWTAMMAGLLLAIIVGLLPARIEPVFRGLGILAVLSSFYTWI